MSMLRPIDRLASWWFRREESKRRPPVVLECADCGKPVAPGEGVWFPQWRQVACSEDCSFAVQADHF